MKPIASHVFFSLTLAGACLGAPKAERPNVVFFFVDDLGWSDIGCNGGRYYETPRIDAFAKEGMRFTDAYVAAPNCAPSRAALLFGQYGPRTGNYHVGDPQAVAGYEEGLLKMTVPAGGGKAVPLDKICFATPLSGAGYAVGHFGKWHNGESRGYMPLDRGFTDGFFFPKVHTIDDFGPFPTMPPRPVPAGIYQSDFVVGEALRFIEEKSRKSQSFFAYISFYNSVHATSEGRHVSPDPALTSKYTSKPPVGGDNNPVYAAKIEHMDRLLGIVLNRLDELGLAGNTIVILYSDNGAPGNYKEMNAPGVRAYTDNTPLRGGKSTLYEGGIRVPLIIRWPGVVRPGSVCSVPVTSVDLYPTFLDVAKIPAPKNHILDGRSLLPLLESRPLAAETGKESPLWTITSPYATAEDKKAAGARGALFKMDADLLSYMRPIFWHFPVYYGNIKKDGALINTPNSAVRAGPYKLIEFFDGPRIELYDLRRDLGEKENLAEAFPEITRQLHALLKQWQKETGAFIPVARERRAMSPATPPADAARQRRARK